MVKRWKYRTDVSDAQWEIVRKLLPKPSGKGRPQTVCRREVLNAVLYVNRSGCQWRLLPHDFPKWRTVYTIFRRWRKRGVWQAVHDALVRMVRKRAGKKPIPTAAIIDSQSVRTTESGGDGRGYDAGKKIPGRKRHIIVDTLGMILAVIVHGADQQDNVGACLPLYSLWEKFQRIKVIFADSAYGRSGLPEFVKSTLGFTIQTVLRPFGAKGFFVLPKRWIVERTFAWLGRCRRHSKDYETNPITSEAMIHISMIHLMLRRLEPAYEGFEN
jgi:putative transposase